MGSTSSKASRRNPLFDLWRGLALVDMAWVHLAAYPIGMPTGAALWVSEHTRFAAGFFVMLAGLTIRLAFGRGLASTDAAVRQATVRRLLRRAALLVFVDRLAGVVFAATESLLQWHSPATIDPSRLLAVATFQLPGATGGLLVLYTILLTLTAPLERLRSRAGEPAVLALSLAVFALAQWIGAAAHWPPWTFPIAHWQPLFVIGYLATPHIDRLRDASGRIAAPWLALAGGSCAAVFALRSGPALGLPADLLPSILFRKVPLNAAELAWYTLASVFVLVASASLYEASARVRRNTAWLRRLGRWSLVIYVAHLLVELPIISVVTWLDPPPALRAMSLVVVVLVLDRIARAADWTTARRTEGAALLPLQATLRRLVPVGGVVGSAVAAVCAMVVLSTPPPEWAKQRRLDAERATAPHESVDVAVDLAPDPPRTEDEGDEVPTLRNAEVEAPGSLDGTVPNDTPGALPGDDGNDGLRIGDAEFTRPPDDPDRDFDSAPPATLPFAEPPFGEMPIEELIEDEVEPIAN